MTGNHEYAEVDVPQSKHPTEFTFVERRAEIFRLFREASDPQSELSQTELAERYDMAVSTIHDDFNEVKAYIRERVGEEEEVKTDLGFDRAVRNLEQQGEWMKAARVRKMKWEWLFDTGAKEKEPDKHEHEHDATAAYIENLKQSTASMPVAEDAATDETDQP